MAQWGLLETLMWVNIQRITRAPHCANVVWPDLVSGWVVTAQDKIYDAMPLYCCVGSYCLWTDSIKMATSTFRTLPFATISWSVWCFKNIRNLCPDIARLLAAR
jgi:hypothetical protein